MKKLAIRFVIIIVVALFVTSCFKQYMYILDNTNAKCQVVFEVPVNKSFAKEYPIYSYEPKVISQEDANKFIEYFAEDSKLIKMPMQLSKADYQISLDMYKVYLKDIQESNNNIDTKYIEDAILETKQKIKNAPCIAEKVYTTKGFDYFTSINSGEEQKELGKNFIYITQEKEDGTRGATILISKFEDANNNESSFSFYNTGEYCSEVDIENIKKDILNSENIVSKVNDIKTRKNEQLFINDQNEYVKSFYEKTAAMEIDRNVIKEKVEYVLAHLGIEGMKINQINRALIAKRSQGIVVKNSKNALSGECGYYVELSRVIDGNPFYSDDSIKYNQDEIDNEYMDISGPSSDKVEILINLFGEVLLLKYSSASAKIKKPIRFENVLDENEIEEKLIKYLNYQYRLYGYYDNDVNIIYTIKNVDFVVTSINNLQSELVPAFKFNIQMQEKNNGIILNNPDLEIILSAIDGKAIVNKN